jgi:hypothetical protein
VLGLSSEQSMNFCEGKAELFPLGENQQLITYKFCFVLSSPAIN